ncbi:MAG: AMP-binding protein [Rhodocyclaceae bacterium]|nr:AMP-binding protein [Rhodocyclaceae bacterium]
MKNIPEMTDAAAAAEQAELLNIAHYVLGDVGNPARGARVALRIVDANGTCRDIRYDALAARVHRCAHAYAQLGLCPGEVVGVLCPPGEALTVATLGALAGGMVVMPLFCSFGPQPIATRMALSGAHTLVTTRALYERRIAPERGALPRLSKILLVDGDAAPGDADCHLLEALLAGAPDTPYPSATRAGDPALLHFTSGSSGKPKGVLHGHGVVRRQHATAREALDLREGDAFWCTADPGWVTGMAYGVLAGLACGATNLVSAEAFDALLWYRILEQQRVNVWYASPTALRLLAHADRPRPNLPCLRRIASVGEALDEATRQWAADHLGCRVRDTWWQTETGAIMIADCEPDGVHAGAMGRPVSGIEARVVRRTGEGTLSTLDTPAAEGELAFVAGWPSMFRGYLDDEPRYRAAFVQGLYLTGDIVRRDESGRYWFVGRDDDMIKTSGHLVGPHEIENVLMQHGVVAEAGVVGQADAVAGEIVVACVVLKPGWAPTDPVREELLAHAKSALGPVLAPRRIEFMRSLPHTASDKILRRRLKARVAENSAAAQAAADK